eukprot:CAMPEP_0174820442 /NCGR_PEP_ID=MMETSP1107-20130205/4289_1 /TAXON_ID=36770 /ORGANISM="Paraphysomonas vestita, Strain GFlagA" /LENGTH=525 /DNA_ID=CAMNT_0016035811 /DNA_START=27 /DNA_END=1604 /DNA_ORIENTATION=+
MSRRTKFATGPSPFKVHFTNTEAGKTISGTKRRVVWRFGWTDSEREHEVGLVHSVLSGKKTILEDGREITAAHSVFSSDFSHGWESNGHLFRIEADTSNAADPIYTFTIDGVPFNDFQNKPTKFDPPSESLSSKKTETPKAPEKKVTSTPVASSSASSSSTPKETHSRPSQVSTFDPFADSSSSNKSVDAFGDFGGSSSSSSTTKQQSTKPASTAADFDFFGTSAPVASSASSSSANVDFFSSAPAPTSSSSSSKPKQSNDLLSDFSDLTFTPTTNTSLSNNNSAYVDPFAPAPVAPVQQFQAPNPFEANNQQQQQQQQAQERKDNLKPEWSGLVDLNLKGNPTTTTRQTTTTQQSGPSLSMLSSNSTPTASTPVMVNRTSNAGPIGGGAPLGWNPTPVPPQPSFGAIDPFATVSPTAGIRPGPPGGFGAPVGGGGFGNPGFGGPAPGGFGGPGPIGGGFGAPVGGGGFGSATAPQFGSAAAGISMMGPGPVGGGYGGGNIPPAGNPAFGRPPPSNSLDNLNWKM